MISYAISRAGLCVRGLSAAPSSARATSGGGARPPQTSRPSLGVATRVPIGIIHRALRSDQAQTVDDAKTVQVIAEVMNAVEAESQSIGAGISSKIALTREARYVVRRDIQACGRDSCLLTCLSHAPPPIHVQ